MLVFRVIHVCAYILRLELVAQVDLKRATGANVLNVSTILQHTLILLQLEVVLPVDIGEAPLAGDDDLLATGEFVASTAERLLDDGGVLVLATDGEDNLANVNTSDSAVWLAPSATHTSLEPIGSSTGQHLVDTDDVEGVDTDPQMERVLAGGLGDILVGADTGSFQSF